MAVKAHNLITKIESPTLEAFGHALAGATAGAFALCVLYPLDQIKVRKTVQSQSRILTYRIIVDDFIHFRLENIMDIYRGLSFGILEQFSFNGAYFFFLQIFKSYWKRNYSTLSRSEMAWTTSLITGSIAGLLTQLCTTPLKVIQLRLQTASTKQESTVMNITSSIINTDGITGFWSGMKASAILVVNPAIVQLFYGKIRKYLTAKLGYKSVLIDFFAGALSKAIATILCYPLVMVKMNLQAGSDASSTSVSPRERSPMRLSKSNPNKFKYKQYKNGIDVIEEDDSGDSEKNERLDGDEEFNIDIERESDDDDEKYDERRNRKVSFYHGSGKNKSSNLPPKSPPKLLSATSKKKASMSDIFESTVRENGIFGLYKGLGPKLIHASLSNAITFASKEKFVVHTFAIMLYLMRIKQGKLQKIKQTQITSFF